MKTTLDIDDQLLSEAKALAAHQRTSLTRLIEEGLHLRLRAGSPAKRGATAKLPLLKGSQVARSGVLGYPARTRAWFRDVGWSGPQCW